MADLTVNLSGTPDGNTVNWVATGSITVTQNTSSTSFATSMAPVGGVWDSTFNQDLGDLLAPFSAFDNDDLPLGSTVAYRHNGTIFGELTTIDLDPSNTPGGDDVEFDVSNATPISYPALVVGDEISWSGSGVFTLDSPIPPNTFGSTFTLGTYSKPIDGGNFVVNITAIPEPNAFLLTVLMASFMWFGRILRPFFCRPSHINRQ